MKMTKKKFENFAHGVEKLTGLNIVCRKNRLNWIELLVIADNKCWHYCVRNYREAFMVVETIEATLELVLEVKYS